MIPKNSAILGDEWITPSLVESEYPGLILPEDSTVLEDSTVSEDSLVSEDFLASGDSLISEDLFASENNFTSEYSLTPQEIDVDPLTGMAKNPTVNASNDSNVTALKTHTLTVKSIKCIKAGADLPWWNDDDIYIKVGDQKLGGIYSMDDGQSMTVNKSVKYSGSTTLSLWDEDPGPDDLIGTILVNGFYSGPAKLVTGSGSQYLVSFTST